MSWLGKYYARLNVATSECCILRKSAQKLKNITISHFITFFHNFALKPVELQKWLSPFWKLEMAMKISKNLMKHVKNATR